MSLDVFLKGPTPKLTRCECCGQEREVDEVEYLYDANITHNLSTMADRAGIYHHLWRPDAINIHKAAALIQPLTEGLERLKSDPEHYKAFNPSNGWGNYNNLVSFVSQYLAACKEYPAAEVGVSR